MSPHVQEDEDFVGVERDEDFIGVRRGVARRSGSRVKLLRRVIHVDVVRAVCADGERRVHVRAHVEFVRMQQSWE